MILRRREFIVSVGSAAAVWPRAARAQPAQTVHRVALVFPNAPVSDMAGPYPISRYAKAFVHALRDLGYLEGRNLALERRSAEGRYERFDAILAELVAQQDRCHCSSQYPRRGGKTRDEHGAGRHGWGVQSHRAPDRGKPRPARRQYHGFTFDAGPEIEGKRLQMLKDAVPAATRIAFLGTTSDWRERKRRERPSCCPGAEPRPDPRRAQPGSLCRRLRARSLGSSHRRSLRRETARTLSTDSSWRTLRSMSGSRARIAGGTSPRPAD